MPKSVRLSKWPRQAAGHIVSPHDNLFCCVLFNCAGLLQSLPSVLSCCWLGGRKGIRPVKKTEWWGAGVVVFLEQGADLHMASGVLLKMEVGIRKRVWQRA